MLDLQVVVVPLARYNIFMESYFVEDSFLNLQGLTTRQILAVFLKFVLLGKLLGFRQFPTLLHICNRFFLLSLYGAKFSRAFPMIPGNLRFPERRYHPIVDLTCI